MIEKGCLAYLTYVRDAVIDSHPLESMLVINEFSKVFIINLLSIPPNGDMYLVLT